MQLFLHVVLIENFTQLLRVVFRRAVGLDDGGLVTFWCLREHTFEDLGNLNFRGMLNGCGISTIVNKHRAASVASYGGDLAHVEQIEAHASDRGSLTG